MPWSQLVTVALVPLERCQRELLHRIRTHRATVSNAEALLERMPDDSSEHRIAGDILEAASTRLDEAEECLLLIEQLGP